MFKLKTKVVQVELNLWALLALLKMLIQFFAS
jgi:hypothetical protein